MYKIRTDLAVEAKELAAGTGELEGVSVEEVKLDSVNITRVKVLNEQGERNIGKPAGNYVTVDMPKVWQSDEKVFEKLIQVIAHEVSELIELKAGDTVLVAGLGNNSITPDALGPKVIKNIMVTRHLQDLLPEHFGEDKLRPVAAIAPGVLGQTGVETGEIVKSVAQKVSPAAIIVVDALASRRFERVATTVQISDTGIVPGSGIGNIRNAIDRNTTGVPVIAIGVPMVVDAATLTADVIELVIENAKGYAESSKLVDFFEKFSDEDKNTLIRETLNPYDLNLFVTPKEIDIIVGEVARIVGFAINRALQGRVTIEEMAKFVS